MRVLGVFLLGVTFSLNTFSQISKKELAGQMNPIISSVAFLTIAPDSRAGAMGDAGVATSPDIHSQHWNASKYAFIESGSGVSLSYAPWLRGLGITDINLLYLAGYKRLDDQQVVSGSIRYFSLGDILFTDFEGNAQGNYNPNEFAIDAAYSLKLSDYLSGSLGFRFIRSDLTGGRSFTGTGSETKAGTAGAADLGFYYQRDANISDKNGQYAFGFNISNLGTKITYSDDVPSDFLPAILRLGGRLRLDMDEYNSFSFTLDLNKYLVPTPPIYSEEDPDVIEYGKDPDVPLFTGIAQSFYDAPGGAKEELNEIFYAGGVEYLYRDQFAIRAGYFHEHENKGNRKYFTMGVGIKLNVFGIDFSYLAPTSGQQSPLANTVRFTLSFDFDRYNSTQ